MLEKALPLDVAFTPMVTLRQATSINLTYTLSRHVDEYGNVYRYRSEIHQTTAADGARTIYDIILLMGPLVTDNKTSELR